MADTNPTPGAAVKRGSYVLYDLRIEVYSMLDLADEKEEQDPQAAALLREYAEALRSGKADDRLVEMVKAYREFEARGAAKREEEKRLAAERQELESACDRIKNLFFGYLKATDQTRLEIPGFKPVRLQKNSVAPVEVEEDLDLDFVPPEFVRRSLDLKATAEALKEGRELGFAKLGEVGYHVRMPK